MEIRVEILLTLVVVLAAVVLVVLVQMHQLMGSIGGIGLANNWEGPTQYFGAGGSGGNENAVTGANGRAGGMVDRQVIHSMVVMVQ